MYLEHFKLDYPPFSEEPDVHLFYPGAKRELIFAHLLKDIEAGRPLVKIIGSEGSGKTLLCRMAVEQVPGRYEAVYIDNPIGSFDDLLRIICLDLGMHPSGTHESIVFLDELQLLLEKCRQKKRKVVVILDEAEKIFLATLERLGRAICEIEPKEVLSVVLAGRQALDVNLQQLSNYCHCLDVEENYVLEPLNIEETEDYLKFRLEAAGLSREQHDVLFSEGAVAKIHGSAQGNIRMINILAEESLRNSCQEKSFMVLLDHVDVKQVEGEWKSSPFSARFCKKMLIFKEVLLENKMLAGAGVSAVLLVFVLGMLLSGEDDAAYRKATTSAQQMALNTIIKEPEKRADAQKPLTAGADEKDGDSLAITAEKPAPLPGQSEEQTGVEDEIPGQDFAAQDEEMEPATTIVEEPLDTLQPDTDAITGNSEPEKKEQSQGADGGVMVIRVGPEGRKRKISDSSLTDVRDVASKNTVVQISSQKIVAGRDGEAIFRERRRASASWLAEAYKGSYTIQLMMLSSNQAEENLMKRLVQDQYYAIRNNLYILRKKTLPPTLFVYYGIYKTMEQAREERNTMPVFLRKHHPYALSISSALQKAED
ncbi:MAG: hypothetical protein CSA31_00695 [Desulfobulbus propionicus]|nr:MAG: hypothetical protein CSA31_00695 [Desulfobulbus propionicus]